MTIAEKLPSADLLRKGQIFKDTELEQCFRITHAPRNAAITYITNLPESPKNTFPVAVRTQHILDRFEAGKLEPVDESPFNIEPQCLSEKQKQRAEELWKILEPYLTNQPDIFIGTVRGEAYQEVHEAHGMSKEAFYRAVSRYFQRGETSLALAPDYNERGVQKNDNSDETRDLSSDSDTDIPKKRGRHSKEHNQGLPGYLFHSQFDYTLKHFHFSEKKTIKSSYNTMIRVFFPGCKRTEEPSYRQLLHYKKENYSKMKKFRQFYGKVTIPRKDRPIFSSAIQNAPYPGCVFEIDATIGNAYILSSYFDYDAPINPHPIVIIGRPVIYHIVDVFSRMILAVVICVEGPSWEMAGLAILNLMEDKRLLCKKYGIDLDDYDDLKHGYTGEELFPIVAGMPERLRADHGEFRGNLPLGLVEQVGVGIENHKVFCPDLKGTSEQSFNSTQEKGQYTQLFTVEQSFKVRDEILGKGIDPRRGACLTLHEFTGLYFRIVLKRNAAVRTDYPRTKDMIKKGIPAMPVKLWQYGIKHLGGALRKPPTQQIDKALLLRKDCSTTRKGIHFYKDQYYHCAYAEKHGWFEKGNYQKVVLAYSPHSMNKTYLVNKKQNTVEYIPCQLTERCKPKYQDTGFYDAEFITLYEEEEKIEIDHNQNQSDTTETEINKTINEARKRLPEGGNKPSDWKGMRDNRKEHAEKDRQQRHQAPPPAEEIKPPSTPEDQIPPPSPLQPASPQRQHQAAVKSEIEDYKERIRRIRREAKERKRNESKSS